MTEELGTVRAEDDRMRLRYERRYDASPEEVWAALTEPDSLRRWLCADPVLEPHVGGEFRLTWSETAQAAGSVLVWEPPHVLEAEWIDGDMHSILRFEISASGDGALLVLDHRGVTPEKAVSMGAGWHAHLERLDDVLAGRDASWDRWRPRYESLLPRYDELVSAA
jgi:uncharacterized protein YndB with AHSA1/START domain